jgi:hypothetical protein
MISTRNWRNRNRFDEFCYRSGEALPANKNVDRNSLFDIKKMNSPFFSISATLTACVMLVSALYTAERGKAITVTYSKPLDEDHEIVVVV